MAAVGEGALFRGWCADTFYFVSGTPGAGGSSAGGSSDFYNLLPLHPLIHFPGHPNVAFSSSVEFLFVPSVLNFH